MKQLIKGENKMKKSYIIQKIILFFVILLISGDVSFSEINSDSLILPKYSVQVKDKKLKKKISGLLQLQIQLKKSYLEGPTPVRLDAMKKMGMRIEKVHTQLVYIHLKRKLSASKIAILNKLGIDVHMNTWIPPLKNHPTGFVIADVPVDRLNDLARKRFVIRLATAEQKLELQNDEAAKSIGADLVWLGSIDAGFTGKGVKIAILDTGLDTSHQDIPQPIVGLDYTVSPPSTTIESTFYPHGTHITASAVGRGTLSNGKYKGIAHGADLIFLKIMDNTGGISSEAIILAIKDAVDVHKADIISISFGFIDVYGDGSDELSQATDYAFSKGALVFASAGNLADDALHFLGNVAGGSETDFIQVDADTGTQTSNNQSLPPIFLLNWFDGKGITNDLVPTLFDANRTDITAIAEIIPGPESGRGTESKLIILKTPITGSGLYLKIKNNSTTPTEQTFHIYTVGDTFFATSDPGYTIVSPAVADNAIAVGSYVTRTNWTNYKNEEIADSSIIINEISPFSSRGPRIDEIVKPDIAAPGQWIVSAKDKIITVPGDLDSLVIDNDGTNDGQGPADYLILQGTSMSCSIAAGAAALLIEGNPASKRNPISVRDALFKTASNKGIPTPIDGNGHINVKDALDFIKGETGTSTPTPEITPTGISTPTPEFTPTPEITPVLPF